MEFSFITFYKKASSQTLLWLAFGAALNAAKQVYPYLMKELLKLFPILGLASFMGLSIGCGGAETGDDTPPAEDEQEETTEAPEGAGGTDGEGE